MPKSPCHEAHFGETAARCAANLTAMSNTSSMRLGQSHCYALGVLALALALPHAIAAAEPATPEITEQAIEAAKRLQPDISEADIERARQRHRMPSEAELSGVPTPSTPKVDALPQPKGSVDVEALARRYQQTGGQTAAAYATQPALLVFVSLAMPEASLTKLIEQAARSRAVLLMRGLKNGSLRQTAAHVQRLIGARQVAWQIDPQAFDRYAIDKVPAYVLVRAGVLPQACGAAQCMAAQDFAAVSGDVSIDYALEAIERRSAGFAGEARFFLARLRG